MKQLSKVFPEPLIAFATAVYMALGMPEADAALAADTLVQADLWGHQSHGVLRLSWYAARLKAGVCSAVARPDIIIDAGALAVIDGKDAMGQVLTHFAAQEAIRRAKTHGIGAVGLRNSNHFGTAMYFTLMGPREGDDCAQSLSSLPYFPGFLDSFFEVHRCPSFTQSQPLPVRELRNATGYPLLFLPHIHAEPYSQ